MISCRLLFVGCLLAVAIPLTAQNQYTPVTSLPLGDVFLSLPTSHISSKGTWEVRFTHRFSQSLDEGSFSDRIHSLYGLDSSADIGLGLSYVPVRDLQLSIYRTNAMDDIEFGAKYSIVQQAPAIPFSASIRGGFDWRTEVQITDRTSFFGQAMLSRQFGKRAEVTIVPTYGTKAGRAVTANT